ncbi:uncharacterized protein [Halyomorpha halys]|uniref:uncharacterized protein n=1 Tax=Halyomorpha halys TaxID=286706 RepID=UPI0006D4FBE1|nr:uncharacterized protein LOC106683583 [Halyomorpha halys]
MSLLDSAYEEVIENFLKGDWETVIEAQALLNEPYFLWPKPRKHDLYFIVDSMKILHIERILSIGCGSGLLEWLLMAASDLKVTGIEIDKNYWKSKYARKCFIDLVFPQDEAFSEIICKENNALMFCYFNNMDAFLKYLSVYPGHCLIIIGPENCGKHTEPCPFDENIPNEWELWKSREISTTGDFISIYIKRKENIL